MRPPDGAGLALHDVTAGYRASAGAALLEVSLEVPPGQVVGLVGPNGAGKSTLVRVASRALRPWSGSIRVGGLDPYSLKAREAARLIAVVPQDLTPAFPFTVLEMVLMGRTPYLSPWGGGGAQDWRRVREAMTATSVLHLAERRIDELSGGERQRVVLAQALAQDAPVLLLDEPTTHLDLRHVHELLSIVRGLAEREGTAVLAIVHDLNLASAACDRLVVLSRGAVVAEGAPQDVVSEELLRTVWGVEGEVLADELGGRPAVRLSPPAAVPIPLGRRAHVVGGAGRGARTMRGLLEAGYEVSAGVLHSSDTDAAVAERMNLVRITVPAFSPIDEASAKECAELMAGADMLIVCDAPYGPGNVANLRLALRAAKAGVRTILVERVPIGERDFTGGEATALWTELAALGEVVSGGEELVPGVR